MLDTGSAALATTAAAACTRLRRQVFVELPRQQGLMSRPVANSRDLLDPA